MFCIFYFQPGRTLRTSENLSRLRLFCIIYFQPDQTLGLSKNLNILRLFSSMIVFISSQAALTTTIEIMFWDLWTVTKRLLIPTRHGNLPGVYSWRVDVLFWRINPSLYLYLFLVFTIPGHFQHAGDTENLGYTTCQAAPIPPTYSPVYALHFFARPVQPFPLSSTFFFHRLYFNSHRSSAFHEE